MDSYRFKKDNKLSDFQTSTLIENARGLLKKNRKKLADIQDVMYADNRYGLLIGLQGMDTSGKDSLVRETFKKVNVNGVKVHSFKVPTEEEHAHDYLWRHYLKLPQRGIITIFNRTHYENVLVTRVHPEYIPAEYIPGYEHVSKIDDKFYHKRMEQINNFEQHLVENGTIVLKIFLHLSKEEQKNRLLRRIDKPNKNWKFSSGDLKERKLWDKYMYCYEDLLIHTSTDKAPWYVVPADDKDTARYIVSEIILNTLQKIDFQYPTLSEEEKNNLKIYKSELKNS
jgi:PPK2 family polyphosphate:nucleotide phosphotransferase